MEHQSENTEGAEHICAVTDKLREAIGRSVFGHDDACRLLVGSFLIGGHVLLEGPPGIAKTLLARSFASVLGMQFRRIQFTPDLMPSDITGVNIYDPKSTSFRFVQGPVFTDVLLADEINRTPPKTQAALLEAMEEGRLTIDGEEHPLSDMFFVMATQNPIEYEGTFPLPEAQLDRFMFKIALSYPDRDLEKQMIEQLSSQPGDLNHPSEPAQSDVVDLADIQRARTSIRQISLAPAVSDYIVRLAEATRAHPQLSLGASPRANLHLALAAKFIAALDGRAFVIPDDIKQVAEPVLAHRMITSPEAFDSDVAADEALDEVLQETSVPSSPQG